MSVVDIMSGMCLGPSIVVLFESGSWSPEYSAGSVWVVYLVAVIGCPGVDT